MIAKATTSRRITTKKKKRSRNMVTRDDESGKWTWRGYSFTRVQVENPLASRSQFEKDSQPEPRGDELWKSERDGSSGSESDVRAGRQDENKKIKIEEEEEEEEDQQVYLQVTDVWRDRLTSVNAKLRDRRKQRRKQDLKASVDDRIAQLRDELNHGFEQAMARLQAQQT